MNDGFHGIVVVTGLWKWWMAGQTVTTCISSYHFVVPAQDRYPMIPEGCVTTKAVLNHDGLLRIPWICEIIFEVVSLLSIRVRYVRHGYVSGTFDATNKKIEIYVSCNKTVLYIQLSSCGHS